MRRDLYQSSHVKMVSEVTRNIAHHFADAWKLVEKAKVMRERTLRERTE